MFLIITYAFKPTLFEEIGAYTHYHCTLYRVRVCYIPLQQNKLKIKRKYKFEFNQ